MTKFLIADTARFDSDTFTLHAVASPDMPLPLGAAASRCLMVLLEAGGDIVTKKTLLAQAWEQYGAVVSENNLSQAILQIRRVLQQTGVDPAVLVTVPRIGYRLVNATKVSPFVDANAVESVMPASPAVPIPHLGEDIAQKLDAATTANASVEALSTASESDSVVLQKPDTLIDDPQQSDASEPADVALEPAITPSATSVDGSAPQRQDALAAGRTSVWLAIGLWTAIAAASTLAAIAVIPGLRGNLLANAAQATWQAVPGDTTGRYFVSPIRAHDPGYIAKRIDMLKQEPPLSIDDLAQRRVYINGSRHDDVFSYLLCKRAIDDMAPDCLSYLLTHGMKS